MATGDSATAVPVTGFPRATACAALTIGSPEVAAGAIGAVLEVAIETAVATGAAVEVPCICIVTAPVDIVFMPTFACADLSAGAVCISAVAGVPTCAVVQFLRLGGRSGGAKGVAVRVWLRLE